MLNGVHLTAVLARSQHSVIGKGDDILERIPDDLGYLKRLVDDSIVIMGRKTWESCGDEKFLYNCKVIVVSRSENTLDIKWFSSINCLTPLCHLGEHLLRYKEKFNLPVFVLGGAEIYDALREHIDHWLITDFEHKLKTGRYPEDAKRLTDRTCETIFSGTQLVATTGKTCQWGKDSSTWMDVEYNLYESTKHQVSLKQRRFIYKQFKQAQKNKTHWVKFKRFFK